MKNWRKCFNRPDLILTAVFSVISLSIAGAQEPQVRIVNGVREVVYTDPEPPAIDPYQIELTLLFGTDQGEDSYFFKTANTRSPDR